jgi:acyl-[acyl-carrier-protein]-phospholipid O-acyltransferase/long-chain-fatty-acid--[acyl-carrier-protein] ligase
MQEGKSFRIPFDVRDAERSIFDALVGARSRLGGSTPILVDGDGRTLTYDEIIRASFALGHALKKGTARGEYVAVMLPTGAAGTLCFLALSAYGRIPTMLNFTSGAAGLKSALRIAQARRIITARRLVEVAGLEDEIAALADYEIVYLEDVRKDLTAADKLAAVVGRLVPSFMSRKVDSRKPAVVLFTSGTEGEPKGVVLSHRNILANLGQVRAHIDIYPGDVVFNPLPIFHCFGLTVGTLLPLIAGVKLVCHPTPLQPREIARRIRTTGATILLSTDTFINQYARAGEPGDLDSLRLAVCGAERLRDETRSFVRRKYGITLLEGYGVTEASPVVAANQVEANHPGTVGRLMAGMETRLEPVEGISGAGRLLLKGPNIMLGYIRAEAPGHIVPPQDGWYDTGDVVSIDDEGFIAIRGRVKRFAKIGGEMVSLAAVESLAAQLWPDVPSAVATAPDPRKGERLVLVTQRKDATRADFQAFAKSKGAADLMIPAEVVVVDKVPVLGTGKIDMVGVAKFVKERAASAPAEAVVA